LLIILIKSVVILFIAFNYLLYPQNTKNSHFHQIIHPIFPNHTLIPIGSVIASVLDPPVITGHKSDEFEHKSGRGGSRPWVGRVGFDPDGLF
jgi:hypothetical protein